MKRKVQPAKASAWRLAGIKITQVPRRLESPSSSINRLNSPNMQHGRDILCFGSKMTVRKWNNLFEVHERYQDWSCM